jgi:hypothetical protein
MSKRKRKSNQLKLYECHERDENGQLYLVACLAVNRKEAELKIHQPKWWQKSGIRPLKEFR